MFHVPAHKQTDPAKAPGQIVLARIVSRPDPGVVAIEALSGILASIEAWQKARDEADEAVNVFDVLDQLDAVSDRAAAALATVAARQASDFVPITGETLVA